MYEAIEISMKWPKKFKDGIQGQYTTNIPEEEFKNNKYGFYEIQYVPPTNINYLILTTR